MAESELLGVAVSKATRRADGDAQFVEYCIDVRSSHGNWTVAKRYSDFLQLWKATQSDNRGIAFPSKSLRKPNIETRYVAAIRQLVFAYTSSPVSIGGSSWRVGLWRWWIGPVVGSSRMNTESMERK
jgi:hypothetical protein